jgi:HK97 family phage portal protein
MQRLPINQPTQPDLRKQAYYAGLGQLASGVAFRSVGLKSVEAWNAMFPTMFEGALSNTPSISEVSAQRIATVFTCLNIRGETFGSLPFSVKKNTTTGPATDYKNKVHRLIHDRPNEYTTAFDFWNAIEKLKLAWGNAYAEIIRDSSFEPSALIILLPQDVKLEKSPSGDIYYKHKERVIRSTDILHFKNYTMDGLCGISSIRQNAMTLSLAMKLNQYNSSIIGDRPPGYLVAPPGVRPKDAQQKDQIKKQWDDRSKSTDSEVNTTASSLGGIPLLYGGVEFKSFSLPADDVAYIESAKLKDQDIYGIFRIPPTLAENYEKAPYNSSEQQDIVFVKYSLASIREIEQECTEKLFPESNKQTGTLYCKMDLRGLLRGDTNARKEFYGGLFNIGAITPNQICELEDLPTYGKDGDQHFVQGALVPIDKIADIAAQAAASKTPVSRAEIIKELREKIQPKLNGHYADIADILN